ncbi:MarR family winged helix-turn-helix transcriptional regulator [Umezawaea beigongshangensis]|uniref:MarR family winged helix-turn-helix transcriptional regulator n=1 Tax=Umezawaea beigongshangensis TaxID=2780383 RepID=UPI0018F17560|nr:MarR family winged helix-turn-helix transcriptional regulator [Umezawaea beigongshangensis]
MNDPSLALIEQALGRLRRNQVRRSLGQISEHRPAERVDLSLIPVLYAVEEGAENDGEGVTVGLVADRIGLDPSRASRMVGSAIQAGYLERVASQTDGRRIQLRLTEAGADLAGRSHEFRQAFLGRTIAHWSEHDRSELARLFSRFAEELTRIDPC